MWQCPVCLGEEKKDYICTNCGFDERTDFIQCRTLSMVKAEDFQLRMDPLIRVLLRENKEQQRQIRKLKKKLSAMEKVHGRSKTQTSEVFSEVFSDGMKDGSGEEQKLIFMRKKAAQAKKVYESYKNNIKNVYVKKFFLQAYGDGNYQGYMRNGRREGYGIMEYTNDMTYEGQWKSDKKTGYGIEKQANGFVYEGEFLENKRQGFGICHYLDGTVYEGYFQDGIKNGYGKETYTNGVVYEGDFCNGKLNGYGICIYANGVVYKGHWTDGMKDGKGKEIRPDGSVCEGCWEKGQFIEQK